MGRNFIKFSKILSIFLVVAVLIGCENNESKLSALEAAYNDDKNFADMDKFIEDKGYTYYENGSYMQKYAYIKSSGDKVQSSNSSIEVFETEFIYTKDYEEEEKQVNLRLTRTTEDSQFIYNISEETNTILIQKEVILDCSKGECSTSSEVQTDSMDDGFDVGSTLPKAEKTYENYLYNVETNKLSVQGEGEMNIKLKDIEDDLEIYFEELEYIYNT